MKLIDSIDEALDDELFHASTPLKKKLLRLAKLYFIFLVMTLIFMSIYIEIGVESGWPRAERWNSSFISTMHTVKIDR